MEIIDKYRGCVFSFGSGVQSTAIFYLLLHKPKLLLDKIGHLPDYILFADTGGENQESIENFEQCRAISEIPMYRIKNWKCNAQTSIDYIPWYVDNNSKRGQLLRRCTRDWKIAPIKRAIKKLYKGVGYKHPVSLWLGISTDEISRVKISATKYLKNIYPLIEMRWSRNDCLNYLRSLKISVGKSACFFCPYQVNRWQDQKQINQAIEIEKQFQANNKLRGKPYLHPSLQPLEDVYKQQQDQYNLFDFENECDGYCGV